ncbi:hypothetical protein R6Q59_009475 [Mikania micrantha]
MASIRGWLYCQSANQTNSGNLLLFGTSDQQTTTVGTTCCSSFPFLVGSNRQQQRLRLFRSVDNKDKEKSFPEYLQPIYDQLEKILKEQKYLNQQDALMQSLQPDQLLLDELLQHQHILQEQL